MIRRRYLIEIIFILIFLLHCGNSLISPKDDDDDLLIPLALIVWSLTPNCTSGSDIWARNIESNRSECIKANLVGSGKHMNLYVESGLETSLDFNNVIQDFDIKIHPALVETFGSPSDQNGDGKIDVFVLDIRDGSIDGGPFVAGFFDAADLFPDNPRSTVRSNQREILYMDGRQLIDILNRDPLAFGSTLAHEYQHLIRFPLMQNAGSQDDVWINEGTSEVASDIGGFGPQTSRIRCLRGDSNSPCSGGGNGVSLLEWTTGPPNDSSYVLKQYSYAYAFMRYIYDNSGLTEQERKSFFQKTVKGNNGVRASNALNLISLFKANADPSAVLSGTNTDNFQILLNSFWGQVIQGSNMSNISRSGGAASPWDITAVSNAFPLGTTLDALKTSSFTTLATTPSQIRASSMVRVSGNQSVAVTGTTGTTRLTSIPSGAASTLVFGESNKNISLTKSQPIIVADLHSLPNGSNSLEGKWKSWALEHEQDNHSGQIPGGIPVCGHPFLSK
ncbi:peptidase MA family protein [Leptospira sp. GIMC2001]|uniref:peptidase MA family protein n=1 Tax=Leptospira sp. GIMC2001 TaxID=1513297 RepID=UPI00234AF87F|nr:peptidase MA family protein [Leptospira sp. GIMC2001]WCL47554.1 peptidase MA family protein [Leptospira sp. GIMC2001]